MRERKAIPPIAKASIEATPKNFFEVVDLWFGVVDGEGDGEGETVEQFFRGEPHKREFPTKEV